MKTQKTNSGIGRKVFYTVMVILFAIYSLSIVLPIVWGFFVSLKTQQEYNLNSPFALPEAWKFVNYVTAFKTLEVADTSFFGMMGNSLWFTIGMTAGNVFVCSQTAYILAKYPFKGSKTIYNVIVIVMLMPIVGSGPSSYRLFSKLKLINNPLFVISNAGGLGIVFLYLHACYRGISWEYGEAAMIDGANGIQIYFSIMFPQALSMVATLSVTQAVGYWNNYTTCIMYLPKMPNLAYGLYLYEQKMIRGANIPVYFAGLIVSMIPVIIAFVLCQNSIMEKVSLGGLKG